MSEETDNREAEGSQNDVSILASYIDTTEAHERLYKWLEAQSGEQFVRDVFFINKMTKNYYGCIGFWFKTRPASKDGKASNTIVVVPGGGDVPEELTRLSENYNYFKVDEAEKEFTPITVSEDEAEPLAYEMLRKRKPSLFDENGGLKEGTELVGSFNAALPLWEGTYNVKFGREHKFYIDAQTGEVTGESCSDKEKSKIKGKAKKARKAAAVQAVPNREPEAASANDAPKAPEQASAPAAGNEGGDDGGDDEDARKRYVLIGLIVVGIVVLMLIINAITKPSPANRPPSPGQTVPTSINAKSKPKFDPKTMIKKEAQKKDENSAEAFVNKIMDGLKMRSFDKLQSMMAPAEELDRDGLSEEGFTNRTEELNGGFEGYFAKSTAIFPERSAKVVKEDAETVESGSDASGSSNGESKPAAKVTKRTAVVESSFIEDYKDSPDAQEIKNRQICRFTITRTDSGDPKTPSEWRIVRIETKYETPSQEDVEKITGKKTEAYSKIDGDENPQAKEEPKNELSQTEGQPAAAPQSQPAPVNSDPVRVQTEKPQIVLPEISKPEPRATSASEGSESGSAGGSVE